MPTREERERLATNNLLVALNDARTGIGIEWLRLEAEAVLRGRQMPERVFPGRTGQPVGDDAFRHHVWGTGLARGRTPLPQAPHA